MAEIGFIGAGHIAAPMARFLFEKGHNIHVTYRNAKVSSALKKTIGATVSDPQDVVSASEIIFLCLRPHIAHQVIEPLTFSTDQTIISVMAGIDIATLEGLCAPAQSIAQTLPLGFLETGGCPLASFGNISVLQALFEPENHIVPVANEAAFKSHFAICALVPGILDLVQSGADWLAARTDDEAGAEFFTAQLLSGFLHALDLRRSGVIATERDALATEGTLSLMMTEGLRKGGAHDALVQTMQRIEHRLETS